MHYPYTMCWEQLYVSLRLYGDHEDIGDVWTGGGERAGVTLVSHRLIGRQ